MVDNNYFMLVMIRRLDFTSLWLCPYYCTIRNAGYQDIWGLEGLADGKNEVPSSGTRVFNTRHSP